MMEILLLSQLGSVFCQLGLQIAGFVLVDDTALGKFVNDGIHLGQLGFSFGLFGDGSEFPNLVTHGLGIVTVVETSLFSLTNSFE